MCQACTSQLYHAKFTWDKFCGSKQQDTCWNSRGNNSTKWERGFAVNLDLTLWLESICWKDVAYPNFLFMTKCKIESFDIFLSQLSLSDGFSQKCFTSIKFTRVVIESLDVVIFSNHARTRRREIICLTNFKLSSYE